MFESAHNQPYRHALARGWVARGKNIAHCLDLELTRRCSGQTRDIRAISLICYRVMQFMGKMHVRVGECVQDLAYHFASAGSRVWRGPCTNTKIKTTRWCPRCRPGRNTDTNLHDVLHVNGRRIRMAVPARAMCFGTTRHCWKSSAQGRQNRHPRLSRQALQPRHLHPHLGLPGDERKRHCRWYRARCAWACRVGGCGVVVAPHRPSRPAT